MGKLNITTEKAFDLLPYAVDIYDKLKVDNYIKATNKRIEIEKKQGKEVDQMIAGIDLFKFVLKNLKNVKEEVFSLLALLEDRTTDEIRNQSMVATVKSLKELFENKELLELFKSAM